VLQTGQVLGTEVRTAREERLLQITKGVRTSKAKKANESRSFEVWPVKRVMAWAPVERWCRWSLSRAVLDAGVCSAVRAPPEADVSRWRTKGER
jgi:hypothetical protein